MSPAAPVNPFAGMDIRTLIDARAASRADHPFMLWEPFEGTPARWTYAAFGDAVRGFAAGLQARGVAVADRVLVHLDNCPESVIAWLGTAYAGAVPVTSNARSTRDELAYIARHSGAVAGITQPRFASLVAEAAPQLRFLAVTETDNGAPAQAVRPAGAMPWDSITAAPASLAPRPHDPMAHFAIQYTSGTTARPKAVLWTHANALWGAKISALNEDLRPEDVHLVHLPLFHTNAQVYSMLASLWAGASVVLQPRFSASRFWPVSLKHRCSWTSVVPFCVNALLPLPVPKHHYRLWGNAVCEPPPDAYFGVKTIGWWGMTETITHGTVGSVHLPNAPLSMGRPGPGYEVFVLDDNGAPVRPGETGDLFVRGQRGISLFLEYANDPAATAAAFTADGLFITGDRVTLGADGALYFADRSKDMLKVGGENVAASEIERVIQCVPGVKEVAVVAAPHPMLTEVPVAFVVPLDPSAPDLHTRIAAACQDSLASFKQPHALRFIDALPRGTLEKVTKAQLRALLAEENA